MEVMSHGDAKAAGLQFYYTGKPCKHGHVAERYVNGGCIECRRRPPRGMSPLAEARAAGLKFYFTGKPCKRGHIGERWVSTTKCLECNPIKLAEWGATPLGKLRRREASIKRNATPEARAITKLRNAAVSPEKKAQYAAVQALPENKARTRARKLWRAYKLTPEEWDALLASQGFRCAICRTDEPRGSSGVWHTDHCHVTGKVRGLLCHSCNHGIGALGDNAAGVRKALEFLERFECQTPTNDNSTPLISPTAGPTKPSLHIVPKEKLPIDSLVATSLQNSNVPSRKSA